MAIKAIIQTVGRNVKALRQSALTPREFRGINKYSGWIGVPNGTLDRIERGLTDPQLSHLLRIASRYAPHGIHPWHLFMDRFDPMSPQGVLTAKEMAFHHQAEEAYAASREGKNGDDARRDRH